MKMRTKQLGPVQRTAGPVPPKAAFTLIELLVVIAIVGLLAAILVPLAGSARSTALKRRATVEMSGIQVAVMEFQRDHKYMPWPPESGGVRVGEDKWTQSPGEQAEVMVMLMGDNAIRKAYLQIPEKSRQSDNSNVFIDPWGEFYRIGMDRNLDGQVTVAGSGIWDGQVVRAQVLVYSLGPTGENKPMKTFDVPE